MLKSYVILFLASLVIVGCSQTPTENETIVLVSDDNGNGDSVINEKNDSTENKVLVEKPKFSLPAAGFYSAFELQPPIAENDGVVHCTLDGSIPDESSPVMNDAMSIAKTTVVRCSEFVKHEVVAKTSATYFIDETIDLPVVSISVVPEYFDEYLSAPKCSPDPCKSAKFWEEREEVAHIEYFAEGSMSKEKAFEIDVGISIMGGYSRNQIKKSVSISMRSEIQDGRLKYSLFDTRPEKNKFKSFILRNNGNRFVSDYIEDAMATSLLEGTDVDYQRGKQVVVFYNGTYYGIHNMREKLNEHFVETNYGIDSKVVDVVKHINDYVEASGGSEEGYLNMLQYASSHDFSGIDNASYKKISAMLDVGSYAEYMAAEIFYQNGDWPNNNVRAWHAENQPWKFMAYDIDHGFDWEWNVTGFSRGTNMFDWIRQGGNGGCKKNSDYKCFHNLYVSLIKNPDFKRLFLNRSAVIYNSFVNARKVQKTVDTMVAAMPISEIKRDLAKFPRQDYWYQNSCGTGFEYTGDCLKSWAVSRDGSVWKEFVDEFALGSDVEVTLASSGDGKVLLDGMKLPKTTYTGKFFGGNQMLLTAVPGTSGIFSAWNDGSTENPRLVTPKNGDNFTAIFK